MSARFFTRLVNGPFGDPALYLRLPHNPEAVLFDCGDLHPLTPRACLKVRRVFVSHAHIDHLVGFDQLLRLYLYRNLCLRLYGPPGLTEIIRHRLGGYSWNLMRDFPFILEVTEWGRQTGRRVRFRASRAFALEELPDADQRDGWLCRGAEDRVRALPFDHGGIDSLGFCLEQRLHVAIHPDALAQMGLAAGSWLSRFKQLLRDEAAADTPVEALRAGGGTRQYPLAELAGRIAHCDAGVRICYLTDLKPTADNLQQAVRLAAGANLLAIEAPFLHQDFTRALERNHLTARLAGELAGQAEVGRLLVFHHSPRYQDRPRALWREAEQARRQTIRRQGGFSLP